ncbi:hypothetical protein [Streptomyces sp. NPDC018947]|uniref:hypothetical protein n=1 Tax=Streptomyces sp. NPDC018947 TaxID=3365054 RepID=UPI00379B9DAA
MDEATEAVIGALALDTTAGEGRAGAAVEVAAGVEVVVDGDRARALAAAAVTEGVAEVVDGLGVVGVGAELPKFMMSLNSAHIQDSGVMRATQNSQPRSVSSSKL